jgi:hypothetical protein
VESVAAVYTVQRRNPEGQPIPEACTAERDLALARTGSASEGAFQRAETVLKRFYADFEVFKLRTY